MVTAIPVSSAENVVTNSNVTQEDDEKFLYGDNTGKFLFIKRKFKYFRVVSMINFLKGQMKWNIKKKR